MATTPAYDKMVMEQTLLLFERLQPDKYAEVRKAAIANVNQTLREAKQKDDL